MRPRKPCPCYDCILAHIHGAKRCETCAVVQRERKRLYDRDLRAIKRAMTAPREAG